MPETILIIVVLAILFDISNGWNDSANAIATVVSTKVLSPLKAVFLAASMNILGAFFSTAVAKTIGEGIVSPENVTNSVVIAALVIAFLWNAVLTRLGMPISCSHALIGGLMGSSVAHGGLDIHQLWRSSEDSSLPAHFSSDRPFLWISGYETPPEVLWEFLPRLPQQEIWQASAPVRRVHGLQPRVQRRPKGHGGYHPCPGKQWSPFLPGSAFLGYFGLRQCHGAGDSFRRMAGN